ncbi:PspC domain-containing protein [Lysinibacter cavernae]|uniref:Phage shock protein PspC (Stress-responsive transcriptional regulator) n=1 Tax=Lysinibacter cavernae TaxID=1640652 RepID=A0A7X5R4N5_9MICO|nr:PspC domain-containing protein [Lysinibacter cavernae]NIH55307.1 phage shock protein PspC (stress-responsive transcriptional regulator) [Lysinibacter cavernae]
MNEQQVPPTGDSTQPAPPPGYAFFNWIRGLGITRTDDSWIGGVCSGIAAKLGIDPMIVRGIAIVVAIFGGPVILFYAAAWMLLPDQRGLIHFEQVMRGNVTGTSVAIFVIAGLSVLPWFQGLWWQGPPGWWGMPDWLEITFRVAWTILVVGAIVWLISWIVRRLQNDPVVGPYVGSNGKYRRPSPHSSTDQAGPSFASATSGAETPGANGSETTAQFASNTASPTSANAWTQSDHASPTVDPLLNAQGNNWADPQGQAGQGQQTAAQRHAQQQQHREQRAAWKVDYQEQAREHKRRQLGAGYVAIWLGLAAIAGAVVAFSATATSSIADPAVLGFCTALAVLGIATVVAGIRGKQSGGLGFFSFVAVVATLVVGVFPWGTHYAVAGSPQWAVSSAETDTRQGFALVAGGMTVDLTELGKRNVETGGIVDVWLVAGSAKILLPSNEDFVVQTNAIVGSVTVNGVDDDSSFNSGSVFQSSRVSVSNGEVLHSTSTPDDDATVIRVWSVAGSTTADVITTKSGARS